MSLTVYLNGSGTIQNCKCCKTLTFASVVITDSASETMTPQQFVEYGQSLPCNPCGSVIVNCKKYNLKITNSKIVNNKLVLLLSKNCKLPTGYCKSVKVTMLPCESSNSELYGLQINNIDVITQLVKINQQTGDVTIIGETGETGSYLISLAYDKSTKTLYGISYLGEGMGFYSLVKVDLSTGNATTIGVTGFEVKSIAINSKGKIYGSNLWGSIYTINKNTGAGTYLRVSEGLDVEIYSISFNNCDDLYLYTGSTIYKYDISKDTLTYVVTYGGYNGSFKPCTNDYYGVDPYSYGTSNMLLGINTITGITNTLQLNVLSENSILNVQFI